MKTTGMMALVAGAAIGVGSTAMGQVIDWNNPAGGSWHTTTNWTPNGEPDTTAEFARFAVGGSYTVSLTTARNIAGIRFVDAGATVGIANAASLMIGNEISGPGLIVINPEGAGAGTYLAMVNDAIMSGTGTIRLNATAGILDRAYLMTSGGGANTWTHGAGHSIVGKGNVYYGFSNDGSVRADAPGETLQLISGAIVNRGVLSATDGGVLLLTGSTVTQSGSGQINAISGPVRLATTTITGGTITSGAGQAVSSASGVQRLSDLTISGTFHVDNASQISVSSTITQTGQLIVNPQGAGSGTAIIMMNGSTLRGAGSVRLNATAGVLDRAYIQTVDAGANTWTHAAGHTILGKGNIYYGFTNEGTVTASEPGETLQVINGAVLNRGAFESSGGTLQFTGSTVTQTGGGRISAVSGPVQMSSSTVIGGTITAAANRAVAGVSGSQTLNNVTIVGNFNVDNATQLAVPTTITNSGIITVNPQGAGSGTAVNMAHGSSLLGGGALTLNATAGVLDRAYIQTVGAGANTWTNGVNHTVRGKGRMYYGFINNGLVSASEAGEVLDIVSGTIVNNAVLRANQGVLRITSSTVQQAGFGGSGGRIDAMGSTVELLSSTVMDGSVNGLAGGVVATGGSVTLNNTTVTGPFHIRNSSQATVPTRIVNNGVMTVNPEGAGSATFLRLEADAELLGSGEVRLNATGGIYERAYLWSAGGTAYNVQGHTIGGCGRIYGNIVNRGTIAPGGDAGPVIDTQQGTITQETTGVMRFQLSPGGQSTRITGSGTKALGGTLELTFASGYTPSVCDSFTIITGPVTGRFARIVAPTLPLGRITAQYTANSVTVQYVPADYNGDGFPDFFDYSDYVACFEGIECPDGATADFNNDGFIDFFDYSDFVAAFEAGC